MEEATCNVCEKELSSGIIEGYKIIGVSFGGLELFCCERHRRKT